jgi:endonuclease-3 related protein
MINTNKKDTKKLLMGLYDALFDLYGPQGWWPADSPWEVCVGAILTQNTNWNNVEKAILNLKKAELIGKGGRSSEVLLARTSYAAGGEFSSSKVLKCSSSEVIGKGGGSSEVLECSSSGIEVEYTEKLLETDPERIAELIRPSGYFNLKTKRLIALANWWLENQQHGLTNYKIIDIPTLRHSLLQVHGVGPETADTIILYAFNLPSFVIDTYTKRICSVYLNSSIDIQYDDLQSIFMDNLPHDPALFNEYHSLLVRLAKEKEWEKILNKTPNC